MRLATLTAWCSAAAVMLGTVVSARAAAPLVAGSERHLWVVDASPDDPSKTRVLHRSPGDPVGRLTVAHTFTGKVYPRGVAASDRRLYLAMDDRTIRTFAVPPATDLATPEPALRRLTELPEGTVPRCLAAGGEALWVLARVEVPEAWAAVQALAPWPDRRGDTAATQPATQPAGRRPLMTVDAPPGADLEMLATTLGLPPGSVGRASDREAADPAGVAPPDPWRPTEVLLVFTRGAWRLAPLPDGWPQGAKATIAADTAGGWPSLLSAAGDDGAPGAHLYRFVEGAWAVRTLDRPVEPTALAAVQGQRVMLAASETRGVASAKLLLALPARVVSLARIDFSDTPVTALALTGHDGGAVVVGRAAGEEAEHQYVIAAVTLRGDVSPPAAVTVGEPPPPSRSVTYVQIGLMVILSALLIFVFAKRGPNSQQLKLEDDRSLGSLGRRGIAALIDLAPPVFVVSAVYGVGLEAMSPTTLLTREQAPPWDAVEPCFMAIAFFIAHTTLGELTTRQTLGKAIMRLNVASTDGKPPSAVQVLIRNVLKAAELIAYLLLLLPLISPFRQRLGDLVARTVVTEPAKAEGEGREDDDGPDDRA